ncbi:hypothetical protein D3C87_2149910 [compost metagenome]
MPSVPSSCTETLSADLRAGTKTSCRNFSPDQGPSVRYLADAYGEKSLTMSIILCI